MPNSGCCGLLNGWNDDPFFRNGRKNATRPLITRKASPAPSSAVSAASPSRSHIGIEEKRSSSNFNPVLSDVFVASALTLSIPKARSDASFSSRAARSSSSDFVESGAAVSSHHALDLRFPLSTSFSDASLPVSER